MRQPGVASDSITLPSTRNGAPATAPGKECRNSRRETLISQETIFAPPASATGDGRPYRHHVPLVQGAGGTRAGRHELPVDEDEMSELLGQVVLLDQLPDGRGRRHIQGQGVVLA